MRKMVPVSSVYGQPVEGDVVVLTNGFSPRYHLDRKTGKLSVPDHYLDGEKINEKILVCDFSSGGVAAGWSLNSLKKQGFAPKALIFMRANPVMVQGAIFADITIAEGLEEKDFKKVNTQDWIYLDNKNNQLHIERTP